VDGQNTNLRGNGHQYERSSIERRKENEAGGCGLRGGKEEENENRAGRKSFSQGGQRIKTALTPQSYLP